MPIFWLSDTQHEFPPVHLSEPDGVLAIGGDLSPDRLLKAYSLGIFPWYNPGEHILWWSPDPRFVLFPDQLKVSKSMRPYFNQNKFQISFDHCFERVMRQCGTHNRKGQPGTWITEEMVKGYIDLHHMGYAHSVEVWQGKELVGGLYGIALGNVFFGESMFTHVNNASKYGFISLVKTLKERGYWLVDCQQETNHLGSLGAELIPREIFMEVLERNRKETFTAGHWKDWS